jgi:hypothetical protein
MYCGLYIVIVIIINLALKGLVVIVVRFLVYEYMANGSLKDHLHCMILLFQFLL